MDFFDLLAPIYDRVFHPDLGKLCQQRDFPTEGWVMDIGGGTGRIASTIENKDRKIIVVDASLPMLLQAKKREQLKPVLADGAALPFNAEMIDGVLIADAYHHFQQRDVVIAEVNRVLIANGILLIFEPNIARFVVKIVAVVENLLGMNSRFFTLDEIEQKVLPHGFSVIEKREDGASIRICVKRD